MNFILNGIVYQQISDHFPVFSVFKIDHTINETNTYNNDYEIIKFRNYSNEIINILKAELGEVDWDLILSSNDVNVAFDN